MVTSEPASPWRDRPYRVGDFGRKTRRFPSTHTQPIPGRGSMTAILHGEYVGTVEERLPWGLVVRVEGETEGLVDRTKVGEAVLRPVSAVTVVVLNGSRFPMRGSLLSCGRAEL